MGGDVLVLFCVRFSWLGGDLGKGIDVGED